MRKFVFALIITFVLLSLSLTFADKDHCYPGKDRNCRQGVDMWISERYYRSGVDYFCGTGEHHWEDMGRPGCSDWPDPKFPRPDVDCPARDCDKLIGFTYWYPWHNDTFTNLAGNEGYFRGIWPKVCWITPDESFTLYREILINAEGHYDSTHVSYDVEKCAVEVAPIIINSEELPYRTRSAYSAEDDHLVRCSPRDAGNNKGGNIDAKEYVTLNLPPGDQITVSNYITVYRSSKLEMKISPAPKKHEELDNWCDDKIVPKPGQSKYRENTFYLNFKIKTCPPLGEPNKKYALPDGSGCTACYRDSDCGDDVCNIQTDYASTYVCDKSDDDPDDPQSFVNNNCSLDEYFIENDSFGCGNICRRHFVLSGETQPFGGYTQEDINESNEKCCDNDLQESFHMMVCIGCESNVSDAACCDRNTDCVYKGKCYDQLTVKIEQDFQGVCAGGVWLGTKPKLLYGKTTYADLPLCGDFICDLLSGENCWSCPADCGLGREFSAEDPENIVLAEENLNKFLCGELGISDCTRLYENVSEKVSCMALCDTPYRGPMGHGKKLKDAQFCRHDCECISNNCVATDPNAPEMKHCCPFGSHFTGQKCVQTGQIVVGE